MLKILHFCALSRRNINSLISFDTPSDNKLEYLAVYGRASMAAFRQISTHGQIFDPESLYESM